MQPADPSLFLVHGLLSEVQTKVNEGKREVDMNKVFKQFYSDDFHTVCPLSADKLLIVCTVSKADPAIYLLLDPFPTGVMF